jgi:periplasmic protein TonB
MFQLFEASLVESTPMLRTRRRWPVFAAFTAQTILAVIALTIPLLHPERLPLNASHFNLTPPILRPTPPPQPPPQVLQHITQAPPSTQAFTAPASQPSHLPTMTSDLPPVDLAPSNLITLATGGAPIPNAVIGTGSPAPNIRVEPTPPASTTKGPIQISTGVSAGLLLAPIRPIYPAIAQQIHLAGTVVVQAIISPTGHIESAHVVSGPALLQTAALEAVRSARYRPYTLNGQPTAVETTFSINFRLSD